MSTSDADQQYGSGAIDKLKSRWSSIRAAVGERDEPEQHTEPTPIIVSHRVRMIILVVSAIALFLLLRSLPGIISILLLGATLALILSFPVRFLQRFVSRRWAITIVTVGLLGLTILALALIIPFLISEITKFVNAMPDLTERLTEYARDTLQNFHDRGWIEQEPDQIIDDAKVGLIDTAQSLFTRTLDNVLTTLSSSVSIFLSAFGMVFVAVYLLADTPKFKNTYLRIWAPQYRADALHLWDTMGFSLSRYLSAQVLSLLIQGTLAFIGLVFLNVPYALILGLFQTVTAILPYVGAWIGAIPAVLIALTIGWETALATAVLYLAINQLEGNFITPNLQGNAVRVHPILIFIGVIGGSSLFGLMGAVLAVPAIAIIRVLFEFFWLRLRVDEDSPTLLSFMRKDTEEERRNLIRRSRTDEDDGNQVEDAEETEETTRLLTQ